MLAIAYYRLLVTGLFLKESKGLLDSLCFWRMCAQWTDIFKYNLNYHFQNYVLILFVALAR